MALPFHVLTLLAPHLKGDVLSLGYPDLAVSPEKIEKLFGYKPTRFTDANKRHDMKDRLPDSEELFEKLGVNLTVVDYIRERGIEKIANLNEPHDFGKFDLVIDPGTLEHCFNIGQAMLNAANAVKVGGRVFHISPMTMLNHGFFNICPTFHHDFYSQNGWVIEDMSATPASPQAVKVTGRFSIHMEYVIRCLARKQTDAPLKFPIQTKYLEKHQ